jgi:hypothetical protein
MTAAGRSARVRRAGAVGGGTTATARNVSTQAKRHSRDLFAVDPRDVVQLQRRAGNRAVTALLKPSSAPLGTTTVQRAPRTAEVRAAIARGDFSWVIAPPLADGGAYYQLDGLSPADLAATIAGLRPAERAALRAGGPGPLVAPGVLRPRDDTAIRAISATADVATATRAIQLVDALVAGTAFEPAIAGLDRTHMTEVVAQIPPLQLAQLVIMHGAVAAIFGPPTPTTVTLGRVLRDLTGGGLTHTLRSNDVIDLGSVRGALNRRCASIYNSQGRFIATEATRLGLSSATVAALMIVESGGQAFGSADRPIARFENHVFDREWGHAHHALFAAHFRYVDWHGNTHFFRVAAAGPWSPCHQNQNVEWTCIDLAANLSARETAYRCASFGAGQIMGFNHARVGFASATAMVDAFTESLRSQISAILTFISASPALLAHARAQNWLPIAAAYNGGGQAPAYAARIARFHAAYARVTRGMEHHVP